MPHLRIVMRLSSERPSGVRSMRDPRTTGGAPCRGGGALQDEVRGAQLDELPGRQKEEHDRQVRDQVLDEDDPPSVVTESRGFHPTLQRTSATSASMVASNCAMTPGSSSSRFVRSWVDAGGGAGVT